MPARGAGDPAIARPLASNTAALGAFEPVWPAQPLQEIQAVGIGAEPGLELADRAWVVQPAADLDHGFSLLRLNGEPKRQSFTPDLGSAPRRIALSSGLCR